MINIQQNTRVTELKGLLLKYGTTVLNVDREEIGRLIRNIEIKTKSLVGIQTINLEYMEEVREYLEWLISDEDNYVRITIKWGLDEDGILKRSMVEAEYIKNGRDRVCEDSIIDLRKDRLVFINYKEVADLIAFELMHRDMGETHTSIERKLGEVGLVTIRESNVITRHFKESPYELGRDLYILSSPYIEYNNNTIESYFSKQFEVEEIKKYRDVVEHSCTSALTLIVESILKNNTQEKEKIRLCGVSGTSISVATSESNVAKLNKSVNIRVFGRRFESYPIITVV